MWNFTVSGFTSVVEYDPPATSWSKELNKNVPFDDGIINKLPADYSPADKDNLSTHVLVRARIKEDLAALLTYDPDAVQTEDLRADYQYRLVMRRSAYATFMYDSVMTLDYNSHVKETIDKRAPKVAGGRYGALSSIWSACARWQPNDPWGNTVAYGGYGTTSSYNTGTWNKDLKANTYPNQDGSYSYYDRSLGKWLTRDKNNKLIPTATSGGGTPKALAAEAVSDAASEAKSGGAEAKGEGWPTESQLDRILDGIDQDNPWTEPQPMITIGQTAEGLNVTADATRNSMIAQLKDIVRERGVTCEIEALVDEIQETWGTCDIESIPDDLLTDMFGEYESVSSILAGMDASG